MKGNPAGPGGSLASKPTWSNTSGCSATPAFLFRLQLRRAVAGTRETPWLSHCEL